MRLEVSFRTPYTDSLDPGWITDYDFVLHSVHFWASRDSFFGRRGGQRLKLRLMWAVEDSNL